MRQPVRPVGQLIVGTPPAIADQRRVVAETALYESVSQLDRRVQPLWVVEAIEQEIGPLIVWRQIVPRERIRMSGGA